MAETVELKGVLLGALREAPKDLKLVPSGVCFLLPPRAIACRLQIPRRYRYKRYNGRYFTETKV